MFYLILFSISLFENPIPPHLVHIYSKIIMIMGGILFSKRDITLFKKKMINIKWNWNIHLKQFPFLNYTKWWLLFSLKWNCCLWEINQSNFILPANINSVLDLLFWTIRTIKYGHSYSYILFYCIVINNQTKLWCTFSIPIFII